jgi:hypothetical protein
VAVRQNASTAFFLGALQYTAAVETTGGGKRVDEQSDAGRV